MSSVVHLTTLHPRSDVRIFVKQAQTLAKSINQDVILMVADGNGHYSGPSEKVKIHDLGAISGGRVKRMLVGPLRAFHAIRNIRPNIVHFHDPELIPLGILLKLMGYRIFYDVHEDLPQQALNKHYIPIVFRKPLALVAGAVEWVADKLFDAIVPATPSIYNRFNKQKSVLVQNFPIIDEMINPAAVNYNERPQWIVYIGGITAQRGAVEMVKAIELLKARPQVRLKMLGELNRKNLDKKLHSLPGWASVDHLGLVSREKVSQMLGEVRMGLVLFHPLPNHTNAQPNKMFEYMSSGLPIIVSDFPLWRSIVEEWKCGLLVDPLDPVAISNAIIWMLDNPEDSEAMGRRGRAAVEGKYNWEVEAKKITGLYHKILENGPSA